MTTIQLSIGQLRRLRLQSQRLTPQQGLAPLNAAQVVAATVALQAQDPFAARLSVWTRSTDLTEADVEQALFKDHTIVRTWCLRGTLHLLAMQDLEWLVDLVGPVFIAANRGRRAVLGLDEETCQRGTTLLREFLGGGAALNKAEIAPLLAAGGIHLKGQALVHLLGRAALEGIICVGPGQGPGTTYMLLEDPINSRTIIPRVQALGRLVLRYLNAYAPAAPEDLATWSGLTLGEARIGWQNAQAELVEVSFQGKPLWLLASQVGWLQDAGIPSLGLRLLPAFDTYLLGYKTREVTIAKQYWHRLNAGGGILHPLVLMDGVAIGAWRLIRRVKVARLEIDPFEVLPMEAMAGIEHEAVDLARFLGRPVNVVVLKGD